MNSEMTGFVATGYMLVEEGLIIRVRNERLGITIEWENVQEYGLPRINVEILKTKGWKLGFTCGDCCGTGESVTRDRAGNLVDCECPKCDGRGTRWEQEY